MPNFTEGDWSVVNGNIYSGDKPIAITTGFHKLDDARLMAQSKKMYEVLNKIMDHFAHGGIMQSAPWIDARAILSEIDKE